MSLACKHSPRGSKRENLFSAAKRAFNYTNTRPTTTSFGQLHDAEWQRSLWNVCLFSPSIAF
jgi:hypothetical protein